MRARELATGAAIAALAAAGCGGDEPAPFKEVKKPATTTSAPGSGIAVAEPSPSDDILAALAASQRKALAGLPQAQSALVARGDALANRNTDADKLVRRIRAGFEPPSGDAPEVRRLAAALRSFSDELAAITSQEELLPELSNQLKVRYAQLVKSEPTVAAHVLDAKQEVDSMVQTLPGLRAQVDDAAAGAKAQLSKVQLDADELDKAITGGAEGATAAVNGVNQAVELGMRALADSA